MRITFVGVNFGTSYHRAKALERLGHDVVIVNPFTYLGGARYLVHTGGLGANLYAYAPIRRQVEQTKPDLIWVDHGAFLGPSLIRSFRTTGAAVINYNNDNAWSPICKIKFRHYRAALPYYDLVTQARQSGIAAAYKAGARQVHLAMMSADEVAHYPRNLSDDQKKQFASEVAFIGTWLPERGPFLAELVRRGVPLSIWGARWTKAPEWKTLAPYWRGPALDDDESYAAAIQSAKICIGLVSKQMVDEYTQRSFEIPSLGGLFCAERTSMHCKLYEEGTEAVFWSCADECAKICRTLLADEPRRAAIARRGRERALRNGIFNEQEIARILCEVGRIRSDQTSELMATSFRSYVHQWLRWFGTRNVLSMRLRMAVLGRLLPAKRLPSRPFTVPLADSGLLYRGILNDWMDWNVFFLGGYKRSLIDLIRRAAWAAAANSDGVLADVGASVGQMTMSASPFVARVLAFEPAPAVATICREHVRLNGLENVTVVETALGDTDGHANFYIGVDNKGAGSLQPNPDQDINSPIKVRVRRGDSLMTEFEVDRLDLLKIDAQGQEVPVIEGFSNVIKRDQPIVIFCLHHIVYSNPDEIARLRTVLGSTYDLFMVRNQFGQTAELVAFNLQSDRSDAVLWLLAVPESRRDAVRKYLQLPCAEACRPRKG
jgi:spore maturation protein CgeB